MPQIATITSKRQLTIPVAIFHEFGLEKGEQVLVDEDNGRIVISPLRQLVEELAGSVPMPKKFKKLPVGKIIKLAKQEYFRNKR